MELREFQKEAIESFLKGNDLILNWATGCGKTYVAIKCIEHVIRNTIDQDPKALIVIAERNHEGNWKNEFKKWGKQDLLDKVIFLCYQSLRKAILKDNEFWSIVVLDEAHHVHTLLREASLGCIKTKRSVALSATIDTETLFLLCQFAPNSVVLRQDLSTNISAGILPTPTINCLLLDLGTNRDYSFSMGYQWGKKTKRFDLTGAITIEDQVKRVLYALNTLNLDGYYIALKGLNQKEAYDLVAAEVAYWKRKYTVDPSSQNKKNLLKSGLERKMLLSSFKTDFAKRVFESQLNKGRRSIIFASSIKQARQIDEKGYMQLHSKTNKNVIEHFNQKHINGLVVVGMANEGVNLVDIDSAILTQIDVSEIKTIQKIGRVLRGKDPTIYLIIMSDTSDMRHLKKIKELTNTNINYYKFNEHGEMYH